MVSIDNPFSLRDLCPMGRRSGCRDKMATISEPLFSYAFLTGIAGAGAAVE